MARLIEADAFKVFLERVRQDYIEANTFSSDFAANVIKTVQDNYLDRAPTVDAVPVAHGRWIPTYHTYYNRAGEYQIADEWHCSECNIYSRGQWNYCPNCGAHMDLEVTEDAYRTQQ